MFSEEDKAFSPVNLDLAKFIKSFSLYMVEVLAPMNKLSSSVASFNLNLAFNRTVVKLL